ncbi:peptidoglycan-associated lipoprotein Pal [uncultured Desulfobacter sp.]|uniref:peptidoglycan-associated lipoprotein Pal n=1 Tax=uncultured Desulfobacter sp. TaxID=240139 RepID=UPI002AAB533B|nr:peptidoglycan-associated lipoprotein Pal [uncultured Desulfobacter sp.]
MKRQLLMTLMVAGLVAGVLTLSSCSKPQVADPGQIDQDLSQVTQEQVGETDAEMQARLEAERIKAQQIEEERLARIAEAKSRFLNQNVLFDYDSSELTDQAKTLLREKADWLQANSSLTVMIEGHCDERGTTVYNLALGERRANTAKNYLVDLGVLESRLGTVSYGEEKPLNPARTEEAYRVNRRAQFVIK